MGIEETSSDFAAVSDRLQRLWTPHRLVYVKNQKQPERDDCPFCAAPDQSDASSLIVKRGTHAYVLLNLFPYNSGHMLVCPYRHFSNYDEATEEEVLEIAKLTQEGMRVAKSVLKNDGFNIGMNQGEVAGAGIAMHLHQHIVPRWKNDSNFFPIIAQTKAMPNLLDEVRQLISETWPG